MANKYAGTKTEKNLWEAFAGESQARNKYTYFASVAKKAGYEQIAALFLKTAENEKEHAKLWFKALGELGDTPENLLHAAPVSYTHLDVYKRQVQEDIWFLSCQQRRCGYRCRNGQSNLSSSCRWQGYGLRFACVQHR